MAKVRVNWGAAPAEHEIKLFAVYNTAHNSIYVLARDERTAMQIAHTANHIYDTAVKHTDNYGRGCYAVPDGLRSKLSTHWHKVERAISRRLEGTLHIDDDGQVAVGDEVIQ